MSEANSHNVHMLEREGDPRRGSEEVQRLYRSHCLYRSELEEIASHKECLAMGTAQMPSVAYIDHSVR